MVDVTRSYIGIVLGNTNFDGFLNDFQTASNEDTVVQLNLRFSLIPVILSGSVKNAAHNEINTKAELARAQYTAAAAVKIHQQISGLISAGKINAAQGQVMEAQFIGSAKLQIDSQVNLAKSQTISKIDDKINKIEQEATFQEVAIRVGHKLFQNENGALLIFGQIGKAPIEGNLSSSTGLNSITPLAWWAPRGLSVQGTGQVELGLEWITVNNLKVGIESYFFHDRDPVISGRQLINNLIFSSDSAFNDQSDFWKINSDMEKFYVKIPSKVAQVEDQFYITTTNFNGKRGIGAGGLVRIIPKVSIQIDSNFDHPEFDYAISEAITFHATDHLAFYLINENIKNLQSAYDQDKSGKAANISSAGVGVSYRLVSMLFAGIHTEIDVNAECRVFYERDFTSIQDNLGCGGGVMLNAKY